MEPLGATTIFLAVCISCLLFLSAWRKMSGSGKLPPGPVAFPIIGNALQLNMKNLFQSMCELREKYGPIFTIYLGSERVVVLYGQEVVKEALIDQGDEFSDRGHMPVFERITEKKGKFPVTLAYRADILWLIAYHTLTHRPAPSQISNPSSDKWEC
uniref:Uncharacterized protein n=1 Tax=Gopherus agassizii TaxID=38772 RepID=A0A452GNH2_9SAUR